jgi:predicted methyltransferase
LAFTPEQHLGNFGDNLEARQIHDDFHIHEEGLKRKTEQRQIKARRKTQLRLKARTKLKDSKALSKIKSFSKLKEDEVNEIIESMDHIVRFKGDLICRQYDVSDSFYIIVKGNASVTVNVEKKDEEKKIDDPRR